MSQRHIFFQNRFIFVMKESLLRVFSILLVPKISSICYFALNGKRENSISFHQTTECLSEYCAMNRGSVNIFSYVFNVDETFVIISWYEIYLTQLVKERICQLDEQGISQVYDAKRLITFGNIMVLNNLATLQF